MDWDQRAEDEMEHAFKKRGIDQNPDAQCRKQHVGYGANDPARILFIFVKTFLHFA